MGPDYCHVLPCPNCSHLNPCHYRTNASVTTGRDNATSSLTTPATTRMSLQDADWKCNYCDHEADADFLSSLEIGLDATLSILERTIESNMAGRDTRVQWCYTSCTTGIHSRMRTCIIFHPPLDLKCPPTHGQSMYLTSLFENRALPGTRRFGWLKLQNRRCCRLLL